MIGLALCLAGEPGVRAEVQSLAIGTADATAAFLQGGASGLAGTGSGVVCASRSGR